MGFEEIERAPFQGYDLGALMNVLRLLGNMV